MMLARQIKDLSIALEALTRVPDSGDFRSAVENLLTTAIDNLHKEQNPPQTINPDDEIPF